MSLFGGISDWLTGGRDQQAEQALNNAMAEYGNIKAPTQQELSLPELQMYVNAGLMTPAQAQAYLQQSNAFSNENIDQSGTAAMQQALGQLSSIADAGPMGTPTQQAQSAQTIQGMNNAVQGQRGAIEQAMQAKGTPAALVQAALQNQYAGQDAQQAYHNSLDQQSAAYQQALQALSAKGQLGGQLQGQQNTQANTVAQAQNAMQQFNAANQQNSAEANAARQQQAGAYNTQNAQSIGNANIQNKNARTQYNTQQRQTAFDDAMQRAAGIAGVANSQASNYQLMGQQAAGVAGGLMNFMAPQPFTGQSAGSTMAGGGAGGGGGAGAAAPAANFAGSAMGGGGGAAAGGLGAEDSMIMFAAGGGMVPSKHEYCYHDGGICMEGGGKVPGRAEMQGDSLQNDTVHARLSPGEAVIPRSVVAQHPAEVGHLLQQRNGTGAPAHPHDVASVLEALKQIRMGA